MNTQNEIPSHLHEKVRGELEADERIKWINMPIPRYFTKISTAKFLFAIPWTAFSLFWMTAAMGFEVPDFKSPNHFFALFGLPFLLIGVFLLLSPVFARRKASKTVYVISNKRAMTLEFGRSTSIKSFSPDQLREIQRNEKRDGSGDVVFANEMWRDSKGRSHSQDIGFLGVRNSKKVERMLRDLSEQASAG